MKALLRITASVPAVGFVLMGLLWWVAPQLGGTLLGMELLSGVGLSSQIADVGSFFITLGASILIGVISANRTWLYPPIMLLAVAIVGRVIAWRVHGADLAIDMIAAEGVVIVVLLLNVRALGKPAA